MQSINSKKITEIVHSPSAVVDVDIQNIVTDSRQAHKTSMFVALKGEKFDGHNFAKSVIEQGCPLVMVERLLPDVPAMRQIVGKMPTPHVGTISPSSVTSAASTIATSTFPKNP